MLTEKQIGKIRKTLNGTDQRAVFKILAETNRYRIFEILATQSSMSVSDIARILDISVPLASQHLKIMLQANILQKEQDGKNVYYNLHPENEIAQSIRSEIM